MWDIESFRLKYLFVAKECRMFSEYTLTITFLNRWCAIQCSNQYVFAPCISAEGENEGLDQLYGTLIDDHYQVHVQLQLV